MFTYSSLVLDVTLDEKKHSFTFITLAVLISFVPKKTVYRTDLQ